MKLSESTAREDYEILIRKRDEDDFAAYSPQLNKMIKGKSFDEVFTLIDNEIIAHIKKICNHSIDIPKTIIPTQYKKEVLDEINNKRRKKKIVANNFNINIENEKINQEIYAVEIQDELKQKDELIKENNELDAISQTVDTIPIVNNQDSYVDIEHQTNTNFKDSTTQNISENNDKTTTIHDIEELEQKETQVKLKKRKISM
ncbi:MAG: hypothetical protein GX372_08790 [Ignavibacteria bacterium]|jgi:predicted RNase H-like HicB family nuclease|nr:hypothetical protein [Ignavibacteria bacterium]